VEVTSTPAESSFFIFTYIPNLDIPPKILRGATKTYFREKHCFLKKGYRNMGVTRKTHQIWVNAVFLTVKGQTCSRTKYLESSAEFFGAIKINNIL
jgi:hypothetical protein